MQRPGGANNPGLAAKLEQERQLKAGISSHKTGLPKKLLELFAPLPPLPYKLPIKHKKPVPPYSGIAHLVQHFASPGDPDYEPKSDFTPAEEPRPFRNPEMVLQARVEAELKLEKVKRTREQKKQQAEAALEAALKRWDPTKDPHVEGDPFKTLFIGRLSYDVTEKKLRREFEEFGPIKNVSIVHSVKTGKPRGYAFLEFEHKNDMKTAYKMADGRKIEGKRVCVDVERGRTVPNWRPRRLAGGKGGESRLVNKEPTDPNVRAKRGLPQLAPGAAPAANLGSALAARAPPPREREREERRPLPPPPAPREQWPVSSGAEERDRERERARENDRERDRPAREERDRAGREYVEKARSDRERERDRDRDKGRERERDRDRGRERERERDRGSDRKRERDRSDRDAGEVDGRGSSKRHRDDRERERSSSRRRERDL